MLLCQDVERDDGGDSGRQYGQDRAPHRLLDEVTEAGDPDLVGRPVLEDLVTSCCSLAGSAFRYGAETSGRVALKCPRHYPRLPSNHP
jgi:hypothetical protein